MRKISRSSSNRSAALFESLENRRHLSVASDVLDLTATDTMVPTSTIVPLATTPVLPNVVRTYSGNYSVNHASDTGTFRLTIRKEQNRGTYASLRGTLVVVDHTYGTITGDMTYGKLIASNLHTDITIQGTFDAVPFTLTISGKSSASGSQIKGNYALASSVANVSGSFLISKVVKS